MTAPRYTAADLEMAAFMASRNAFLVKKEAFRPGAQARRDREYDRVTELNLTFIRGQEIADETRRAA